ncbi:MAG: RluA family pseudouridine synthase [Ruminococcus sp.]|nr:RluA family pseudouridine synthase [Ruminococcus sp.]
MNRFEFTAFAEDVGQRLDKWLCGKEIDLTRSSLQKLISDGGVSVNDKVIGKNYKLRAGDEVVINIPEPKELEVLPQDIPIDIVYEDNQLLVVNKPKGMVVHPAAGNPDGTLVNALLFHCKGRLSSINGIIRPGIVHRIDKFTSGLLMVAKTDKAHNFLADQIKDHSFTREYRAVVSGRFKELKGTIDAPIGRDKRDRKKMCICMQNSKNAVTHYEVIEQFEKYSYVKFILETGRTHQIRVHSAYIGHPVLGDDVYYKPFTGIEGQCLHAKKLGFIHPETKEYMEFDSQLPEYFEDVLKKIR